MKFTNISKNNITLKFSDKLSSSQLIKELLKLNIVCPKPDFWDAIWTFIYIENKEITLPPKGKQIGYFSKNKKRDIFFNHIKEAYKCGKLPSVISFINKIQIKSFILVK